MKGHGHSNWQQEDLPHLYQEYHSVVRSVAYRFYPNRGVIDEIVQETFVKIWQNLGQFAGNSHIKTWIIKIAMNTAIDFLNKDRKWRPPWASQRPGQLPRASWEEQMATKNLVDKILQQLPAKHKQVLILFAMEQLSVEEIAEILEIPIGTVKSRIFKAKNSFAHLLRQEGGNL